MTTALILSGGGARAAYQVGVLRAVMEIYGHDDLPFDVICGTSAGAINAVFVAANAHRPREGIETLYRAWRGITPSDVYDPRWRAVLGNLLRIVLAPFRQSPRAAPTSLLDNDPLRAMLTSWLDFDAARANLRRGYLQTLCITAMDYASGASVAFYEGGHATPWDRRYRRGEPTRLELDHVIASSAIPILFPAQRIGDVFYGDGALRQLHPISPALKFGATRLFVIGVSARVDAKPHMVERRRPSIGQMAGHLLNREFIDNLEADIELAQRFNAISEALPPAAREHLAAQHIDTLVITPSVPFNEIAAAYMSQQPASIRLLFRLLGATPRGAGASFASYLMFDGAFCAKLMELGRADTLRERERVSEFLAGQRVCALTPAAS
jgi:NTE family protein